MILSVVGLQWGDEGKGKILDYLAQDATCVVRYNGGPNAGGEVVVDGESYVIHQLPVGILHDKLCVLGPGMVVDLELLAKEVEGFRAKGKKPAVILSDRCHLITHTHQENDRNNNVVGTTGKGIGYCYSDKALRKGVRAGSWKGPLPTGVVLGDAGHLLRQMTTQMGNPFILLQGVQGTMLDIDHGTYPYVTSSSVTSAGAAVGSGIPPHWINKVLGITKAYTTRVGNGRLPTEEEDAAFLQQKGTEVGTTTGRQRRCGWLDLVALKYAVEVNGANAIAVTKLDILAGLGRDIPVCVAYQINGKTLTSYPANIEDLDRVVPVYDHLPGWSDTSPNNPQMLAYLDYIYDYVGVPVYMYSYGKGREKTRIWDAASLSIV